MNYAQDLESFKLAHKLTLEIYDLTAELRTGQAKKLALKLCASAEEINANLLGGSQLNSPQLYRGAVNKAKASLGQLEYYLFLAKDLSYLAEKDYANLQNKTKELAKILSGMQEAL